MSKKRTLTRLAATVACLTLASAAVADTRLTLQHTESDKPPRSQEIMVTSGHVRMEHNERGQEMILLFHQSANTFYAVQPGEKSYIELDPEKAGAMMDEAAKMRQQAMAQLEEQMKDMPPEQREQMKAMMERMGTPMPAPPEKTRYEARGDSGSAGGFSCEWYDAFEGTERVRELCIAAPSSVGMPSGDTATMKAMQSSMQAIAERFGGDGMFQADFPDGVPIHVKHYDNGKLTSEQKMESISHDTLDKSVFEVPAGYKKQELPTIGRLARRVSPHIEADGPCRDCRRP